jgi:hypothetical protein
VAIILCNLLLVVQKLVIAYIFVFFTGILWPVRDKFDYVVYQSNVSFLSQIKYLIDDSCFVLFCPLLSIIMFL